MLFCCCLCGWAQPEQEFLASLWTWSWGCCWLFTRYKATCFHSGLRLCANSLWSYSLDPPCLSCKNRWVENGILGPPTWPEVKKYHVTKYLQCIFVAGVVFTASVFQRTGVFITMTMTKFHLWILPAYLSKYVTSNPHVSWVVYASE